MHPNSFEHVQQVKWGPYYIICIIWSNPILKLSDDSATNKYIIIVVLNYA